MSTHTDRQRNVAVARLRRCSYEWRVVNCSWTATASRHLVVVVFVCRYLVALLTVGCGPLKRSLTCSWLSTKLQYEHRINCKIIAKMPSVWVESQQTQSHQNTDCPCFILFVRANASVYINSGSVEFMGLVCLSSAIHFFFVSFLTAFWQ